MITQNSWKKSVVIILSLNLQLIVSEQAQISRSRTIQWSKHNRVVTWRLPWIKWIGITRESRRRMMEIVGVHLNRLRHSQWYTSDTFIIFPNNLIHSKTIVHLRHNHTPPTLLYTLTLPMVYLRYTHRVVSDTPYSLTPSYTSDTIIHLRHYLSPLTLTYTRDTLHRFTFRQKPISRNFDLR